MLLLSIQHVHFISRDWNLNNMRNVLRGSSASGSPQWLLPSSITHPPFLSPSLYDTWPHVLQASWFVKHLSRLALMFFPHTQHLFLSVWLSDLHGWQPSLHCKYKVTTFWLLVKLLSWLHCSLTLQYLLSCLISTVGIRKVETLSWLLCIHTTLCWRTFLLRLPTSQSACMVLVYPH